MFYTHFTEEIKQINKKRTFGLAGFLIILVFSPLFFSNTNEKPHNQTQASVLAAQDTVNANQRQQLVQGPIPSQVSPGQQTSPVPTQQQGSSGATVLSIAPEQTVNLPVQEEIYSPQPSIWLFIIPIVITFFTILFY